MNANPTVAIIMPALNAAAHLRGALASLTGQDYDVEAVLVDGGSNDETVAIASTAPNLRVVTAPRTSIYEAINRGIAETRAPAIVLLNTDDMLLPGALAAWREALARQPECGIVRGRATFVEADTTSRLVPIRRANSRAAGALTAEALLRGPAAINSLCIRRSIFDRVGLFDTRYRFAADREWMLRAFKAGVGVAEFDCPVYRYLSHAGSSTLDRSRRNYAAIRREHLDIAARNLDGAERIDPAIARQLRRWHAAEAGMLAWHQARNLDANALASTLARATRLDPAWPLALVGETGRWLAWRLRER